MITSAMPTLSSSSDSNMFEPPKATSEQGSSGVLGSIKAAETTTKVPSMSTAMERDTDQTLCNRSLMNIEDNDGRKTATLAMDDVHSEFMHHRLVSVSNTLPKDAMASYRDDNASRTYGVPQLVRLPSQLITGESESVGVLSTKIHSINEDMNKVETLLPKNKQDGIIPEPRGLRGTKVSTHLEPVLTNKDQVIQEHSDELRCLNSEVSSIRSACIRRTGQQYFEVDKVSEKLKIINEVPAELKRDPKSQQLKIKLGRATEVRGPEFYTSENGYRILPSIFLNGKGEKSQGKYISACATIVKGDFDNILSWPFKGKIACQILDQSGKKKHRTLEVKLESSKKNLKNCHPRIDELNEPISLYKLAEHKKVFMTGKESKFMKDDKLAFRMFVIPKQ